MATYKRMAKALEILRQQINGFWPGRSLAADGGLGDLAHQHRKSDHNPNAAGIVTARDFTHDLRVGFDSQAFAEALIKSADPRIDYVISFGRICFGRMGDNGKGRNAWVWKTYKGPNPHNHHVHVSVIDDPHSYDDVSPWNFDTMPFNKAKANKPRDMRDRPTLVIGTKGNIVAEAQELLQSAGVNLVADGWFGEKTKSAVMSFQRREGMKPVDGIIGPATWTRLLELHA